MSPFWPEIDAQLLADSVETYQFRLGLPTPLAVTPDGAVLFRRTPPRAFAADLYELDTRTGDIRTLVSAAELLGAGEEQLSDAEKARRERSRTATRGVVDIGVSADGRIVMVPLGGKLWLVDRTSGARLALDPQGTAYDPQLSPDAAHVAFVRDGDLWTLATADGRVTRLTRHPDGFEYGIADFAAQEELDRRRGFWWSPDGQRVLFQRTDNRPIDTIYVADARHNDKPPVPFKYPRAGTNNAVLGLGIVGLAGDEPKWLDWDHERLPYIARVAWPERGPASVLVLSREQQDAVLFVLGDDGRLHEQLRETSASWVNVPRPGGIGYRAGNPLWLGEPDWFLWTTERTGAWTLEARGPGGEARAITNADFGLRSLVGVDGSDAIVEASTDPTKLDIWRVPLAGGAPVRVTGGDGVSSASFAHGVSIITTALAAGGRRSVAIANGQSFDLPSVAERPKLVPTTKLETVELAGRVHHVAITRPRAFDASRRYPVLLSVYAGLHV